MHYLRSITLIILVARLSAAGWLDLAQRSSAPDIASDMRALASVMAVPAGDFLYTFGHVAYLHHFIPLSAGGVGQVQRVGFAVQPIPEWVFTAQLWSAPSNYPVVGYGMGANYIWFFQGRNRWSFGVQNNELRGQNTFSQRNLSLTQQYTRVFFGSVFHLQATYDMEKTVYVDLPNLTNHERNYWLFSGVLSKNLFNDLQLDVCLIFNKTRPAGRVGLNWGIGN
ncbi:MAG: hypothetical protein K9N11_00290 [Lentisphaeria bacterium]|nr:hypothetical protein [Candidatus Neomarinimicrobiota bacterium]MCF7841264.1 hypothetical protein [Lentisphaeria bacterium]